VQYAVISDVHANFEALEAVLLDIGQRKIEDIIFLGDAVGYGPNPNECLDLLGRRCKILLGGNHDWGTIGLTDITYFNIYARRALEWTARVITDKSRKMLESLPIKKELKDGDALFVHSTPKEPEEWHYLLTLWDAEINFHYFDNVFCFIGHSHQPFIVEKTGSGELASYKESVQIVNGRRYIINAGSIGQPRDGDPRACYALVDDEKVDIIRVPYDIVSVQNKMREENLPDMLIERLSAGR
jgi:diadenosine tetraphosphatase ApaH/serine/threonine PP2A family protein phosphatase